MYTLTERVLHKIEEKTRFLYASKMRNMLNNTDFTIISNNCWGGGDQRSIWIKEE